MSISQAGLTFQRRTGNGTSVRENSFDSTTCMKQNGFAKVSASRVPSYFRTDSATISLRIRVNCSRNPISVAQSCRRWMTRKRRLKYSSRCTRIIDLLLSHGGNPLTNDKDGLTPADLVATLAIAEKLWAQCRGQMRRESPN